MQKTIILDLDGPILDGKYRHYKCYSDILGEMGCEVLSIDLYWDMKRDRINIKDQLEATGAGGITEGFVKTWNERIERRKYLSYDRVQPGAIIRLREWKKKGMTMILSTMRNKKANLLWQLEILGLTSLFDHVLSVGTGKNYMGKANSIRNVAGSQTSIVMWIGDTEVDIEAARQLGVKSCAVCNGIRSSVYLSAFHPDYIIEDIKSIDLEKLTSI